MRAQRTGYATLIDPMRTREADTFTCAHCSVIKHVKPFCDPADLGGLCKLCMGVICEKCLGKGCDPVMKKIERQEAAGRSRRWLKQAMEQ